MIELHLAAAAQSVERENEARAWTVWQIGVLSRIDPKKYPRDPSKLLGRKAAIDVPADDWREMERSALAWTVNQGGEIQRG